MAKVTINVELSTDEHKDVILLSGIATVLSGTGAKLKDHAAPKTSEKEEAPETEEEENEEEKESAADKAKAAKAKAAKEKAAKAKAAKEKAAKEKAAKEAEESEDLDGGGESEEVTIEQLRGLLAKKVGDNRDAIKEKLGELGAKNIATLDLADYQELFDFLTELG